MLIHTASTTCAGIREGPGSEAFVWLGSRRPPGPSLQNFPRFWQEFGFLQVACDIQSILIQAHPVYLGFSDCPRGRPSPAARRLPNRLQQAFFLPESARLLTTKTASEEKRAYRLLEGLFFRRCAYGRRHAWRPSPRLRATSAEGRAWSEVSAEPWVLRPSASPVLPPWSRRPSRTGRPEWRAAPE